MSPESERMKELVRILNEASLAYYQESREIMPNERYDRLYDELAALEMKTGIILSGSPTQTVGHEVLSALPRERHEQAALSLDKTKDTETLSAFLSGIEGVLSWKLDGLTVVLTYDGGILTKAVTRGNGEIGEVVTGNAKTFVNLPLRIPFTGHLVLRGEAVIRYSDFDRMNEAVSENEKYKNPRNLCAGSVRQLDPSVTAGRNVNLIAFSLITAEGEAFRTMAESMDFLDALGFETVDRVIVTSATVTAEVGRFSEKIADYDIPSDGLVLVMNDLEYGRSLGRTAKFPRNAIAFKWRDEMAKTVLREVEWSASRTGLINPVAVFDPVELEGTTVTRASVHNVSIVEELKLGIGDELLVYKANMIIPQVAENLTGSGTLEIPERCPVCGAQTYVRDENGVRSLYCTNQECAAKQIKSFELFASRNAFKIDGISEMTMEKLIGRGFLKTPADIFRLSRFREEIIAMDGFGVKSYENMEASVNKAREVTLPRLLYALGIPGIGVSGGKVLSGYFKGDLNRLRNAEAEDFRRISGIGDIMAGDIAAYFRDPEKMQILDDLLGEIRIVGGEENAGSELSGKTFVITGSVHLFKNRDELKSVIEAHGGKTASSVSTKTDYLINNDTMSGSTKNKTAKTLGIPILSEEDFMKLINKEEEA